jgi:hypothetical protein
MWRSLGCNGVATRSLGIPHDFFQGLLKLAPLVTKEQVEKNKRLFTQLITDLSAKLSTKRQR